jgi:hypothetical protein
MSSAAYTDPEVVERVSRSLVRYGDAEQAVLAQGDAALARVADEVADAVRRRRGELSAAQVAVRAVPVEDEVARDQGERQVRRAGARLDVALEAQRLVTAASARWTVRRARHASTVTALVEAGRARLGTNARDLATFLGATATTGAGLAQAPNRSGDPEVRTAPGLPPGHALVPLSLIDDGDDGVRGPEEFGKGYSPEDLGWGLDAMERVVLPALALGKGLDYFQDRDAREGLQGSRSYTSTYLGFLSPDSAVTLEPSGDGRFTVGNGRHRVWVARTRGVTTIPARVDP